MSCFIVFVRQCGKHSRKNTHARFITVQLFIAAVLKATVLLWRPFLINATSRAIFGLALLLHSFSVAFNLSAYCILLILLLETTRTTLASPRLQNIWVLLAITITFATIVATFNLLVLYSDMYREFGASLQMSLFTSGGHTFVLDTL